MILVGIWACEIAWAEEIDGSNGAFISVGVQLAAPFGTQGYYDMAASFSFTVNKRIWSGFYMGLEGFIITANSPQSKFSGVHPVYTCTRNECTLDRFEWSKGGFGLGLRAGWEFSEKGFRLSVGASPVLFSETTPVDREIQPNQWQYDQVDNTYTTNRFYFDYSILLQYSMFGIGYSRLRGILFAFGIGL